MKFFARWILGVCALSACSPLPRRTMSEQGAPKLDHAAMSGIVLTLSDSSYASSSLYYYSLATGQVNLLLGGESGDVWSSWLNRTLFVFNRAAGRLSYSYLSPKLGASSRSSEKSTPGGSTFDPVAADLTARGELVLSLNSGGALLIGDLATNQVLSRLADVEFSDHEGPFRPSEVNILNDVIWVAHQALDQMFEATGGGRLFAAARSGSGWAWQDQRGIALHISNPIYMRPSAPGELLVAGVCYKSNGALCVSGVDVVNTATKEVTHRSQWNAEKWHANGGFYRDLTDESLLICMKEVATGAQFLVRYAIDTGDITPILRVKGIACGGVVAERAGKRLIVGETTTDGKGSMTILDVDNNIIGTSDLDHAIVGMTGTYE